MAAVSVAVSVSAMHLIWLRYLWLLYLSKRYYVAAVSVGAVSAAVYIVSLHTCVSNETLARTFGTSGPGYSVQILKKLKKKLAELYVNAWQVRAFFCKKRRRCAIVKV